MTRTAFFPHRAAIDAYGAGGFRFADMGHKGSLLLLPSGIYAWPVCADDTLSVEKFDQVFTEKGEIEFLLLGSGVKQIFPDIHVRLAHGRENLVG